LAVFIAAFPAFKPTPVGIFSFSSPRHKTSALAAPAQDLMGFAPLVPP